MAFSVKNNPALQFECNYITFDDTSYNQCLVIDTTNDSNNVWQVGKPNKYQFNTAFSNPNVIITDTINPYLPNDTSSFYLQIIIDPWGLTSSFAGYYQVNADTLSDYCIMEISPDNGMTWVNVIDDSVFAGYFSWFPDKPVFTGNSGGWKIFEFYPYAFLDFFNVTDGDTILYRFTFISDSIDNNRDGIMFDDFYNTSVIEGIDEKSYNFVLSKVSRSFSKEYLNIQILNKGDITFQLYIFDQTGRNVMKQNLSENITQVNIRSLQNGIYYYEAVNHAQKKYSSGKFIK